MTCMLVAGAVEGWQCQMQSSESSLMLSDDVMNTDDYDAFNDFDY